MKPIQALLIAAAMIVPLDACTDTSDGTGVEPPGLTARAVAGGDGQSAVRGTPLPTPLKVQVLSDGEPLEGARVSWEPSSGSILLTAGRTDTGGISSVIWILGSVPGPMTLTATVEGLESAPVVFQATALPLIALAVDPATNDQVGAVGDYLPLPLRVRVTSEGLPMANAVVTWRRSDAPLRPAYTITAPDGWAATGFLLPAAAGSLTVTATVEGAGARAVEFRATASPTIGATLERTTSDTSWVPSNWPFSAAPRVGVVLRDRFGNTVEAQPIDWAVLAGGVEVHPWNLNTDSEGRAMALVEPTAGPGVSVVRSILSGTGTTVDFVVVVGPPEPLVVLEAGARTMFVSRLNGTAPAVDTISAGSTMTWLLGNEDLDDHAIESVGEPSFVGGYLGYGSTRNGLAVTFAAPGIYRYQDPFWPGVVGTVVVQ